jgi:dipeptidyl-peptidase III
LCVVELLGHGSGKMFHPKDADFLKTIPNPLTGEVGSLTTYPKNGTWDSTFGKIASNYEECRAECCGIYLCLEPSVLDVFGHTTPENQSDIIYINWLLMCRAGVLALEFFTPETNAWRQAHMNARFVILRVLLEAGGGLLNIQRFTADDGREDIRIDLDRSKIATVGKEAIGAFLLRLQVYKSTGDVVTGGAMFAAYSDVSDDMMGLRAIVMARKEPRKLLVQPNMLLNPTTGEVELHEYEASFAGMIQSFVERFREVDIQGLFEVSKMEESFVNDVLSA